MGAALEPRKLALLSDGCVWTTPCVAEKTFWAGAGPDTAGRHHEDAVDWSTLVFVFDADITESDAAAAKKQKRDKKKN